MRCRCEDCVSRHVIWNFELPREVGQVRLRKIDVEILGIELHAHQEESGFLVGMLVRMKNISAMAIHEVGDGGDFALLVRARDEQDCRSFHVAPPSRRLSRRRPARRGEGGTPSRQPTSRRR